MAWNCNYLLFFLWLLIVKINKHFYYGDIEKPRKFQKNISIIDYTKAFDCVDHNKLWKILQQMGIPDHLTCLLRNLYAGQEATLRTAYGTTDLFKIGKKVQDCILHPFI